MQPGLPRIGAEPFLVLLQCVFPTVALKQKIAEIAVPPGGLPIQTRSSKCQTSSEIKVFMPEFEPSFRLVGIKGGNLTKLLGRVSEVFLAQVRRCQGLAGITIRRIELQSALEARNGFLRGAQLEVGHSYTYG